MKKITKILILLLTCSPFLAFAHDDETPTKTHTIEMNEGGFTPENITIHLGDEVQFINHDSGGRWPATDNHPTHTVYPGSDIDDCRRSDTHHLFDACNSVEVGSTYSFRFHESGIWNYHDHLYPFFGGSITVLDATGAVTATQGELDYIQSGELFTRYKDSINVDSPIKILRKIEEDSTSDQVLLRECHPLVHDVGHYVFENTNLDLDSIFTQDVSFCNSGFMHGIIEGYLEEADDTESALKNMCVDANSAKLPGWQCYHGLGHGAMYSTGNNLERAKELCYSLDDIPGQVSCINGVYMEVFNIDGQFHLSDSISKEFPASECVALTKQNEKSDCLFYAPTYYLSEFSNDYKGAVDSCALLSSKDDYDICLGGVSGQMMKENMQNPHLVTDMCSTLKTEEETINCITSSARYRVFHEGSTKSAYSYCKSHSPKIEKQCTEAIDVLSSFVSKESFFTRILRFFGF